MMSTNPYFSLRDLLENPDLLTGPSKADIDKEKSLDCEPTIDFSSAFLGPVLWDKTLPFDEEDFKLQSLGFQEFLEENDLTDPETIDSVPSCSQVTPEPQIQTLSDLSNDAVEEQGDEDECDDEEDLSLISVPGQEGFDPCKRKFSEEELKPQPMIKKSKKIYVPDDLKDEQYWERRNKNNAAAKRSRDARRVKENQIAMRAAFLEKENGTLKSEMDKVQQENFSLKKRLMQYELEAKLNRESL